MLDQVGGVMGWGERVLGEKLATFCVPDAHMANRPLNSPDHGKESIAGAPGQAEADPRGDVTEGANACEPPPDRARGRFPFHIDDAGCAIPGRRAEGSAIV